MNFAVAGERQFRAESSAAIVALERVDDCELIGAVDRVFRVDMLDEIRVAVEELLAMRANSAFFGRRVVCVVGIVGANHVVTLKTVAHKRAIAAFQRRCSPHKNCTRRQQTNKSRTPS